MPWLLECARKIVEADMYFASAENVKAEMYVAQCLGCWNVHGKLWRLKCISPARKHVEAEMYFAQCLGCWNVHGKLWRLTCISPMPGRTNCWREQGRLKLLLTFLLPAVNVMRMFLCCDGKSEGRRSSLMDQSLNSGREDYDTSSVDNRTDTDDRLAG